MPPEMPVKMYVEKLAKQAREAARPVSQLSTAVKNRALKAMAVRLLADEEKILKANQEDVEAVGDHRLICTVAQNDGSRRFARAAAVATAQEIDNCDAHMSPNQVRIGGDSAPRVRRCVVVVVCERQAFGSKIAQKQAIAFLLAQMAIEIDGARLLTWEAAWRLDRGEDALREATLALDQVRRIALEVADGAVQVLGGHGYIREYLPELHVRNARGFASFEALALV